MYHTPNIVRMLLNNNSLNYEFDLTESTSKFVLKNIYRFYTYRFPATMSSVLTRTIQSPRSVVAKKEIKYWFAKISKNER